MQDNQTVTRSTLQITAILLAVAFQIGATFLPNLGLGEQIGDRSDAIRTLVVPAGWAFAIWGPLFFGCAVYAVWQALPAQRNNALLDRIGWATAGATAANGAWATYTQFANLTAVSALIILFSLACLLFVLRALTHPPRAFTAQERWIAALVFSALAAWLTVASTVNISASLKYYGVGGGEAMPIMAAAIILVAALIGSAAVLGSRGNPWYALVIVWAMIAIDAKHGDAYSAIGIVTIAGIGLAVAAALVGLRSADNRKHWLGI